MRKCFVTLLEGSEKSNVMSIVASDQKMLILTLCVVLEGTDKQNILSANFEDLLFMSFVYAI